MAKATKKLNPVVENEFNRLMAKAKGLLKPEMVVEEAKSPTNPLHKYFTWDDNTAAAKWRIQEARTLISSYTVYATELDTTVRALTSLEIDRETGGGYRWTMEVVKRPDMRSQLVETALHELQSVKQKYAHLTELTEVWDAIDEQRRAAAELEEAEQAKRDEQPSRITLNNHAAATV